MRIHLYTVSWNEAKILPFFFRHYDRFVDRYVFFDDGSDDETVRMLKAHPRVDVRQLERKFDSYLLSATYVRNTAWKQSRGRADWVIATDVDEHLYHTDIVPYLERRAAEGVTMIPALGYQMLTPHFPNADSLLCRDHTMGAPFRPMNKVGIFNPDAIEETNFQPGRHFAQPTGHVRYPDQDELLNLHYKYLSTDFISDRLARLVSKIGTADADRPALANWDVNDEQIQRWIAIWKAASIDVTDRDAATPERHRDPLDPRWRQSPPYWRTRPWQVRWWWMRLPQKTRTAAWRIRKLTGLS